MTADQFTWSRMKATVTQYVQSCNTCQRIRSPAPQIYRQPLSSFSVPAHPFARLLSYIIDLHPPSEDGHHCILVNACSFTKYLMITPLKDQQAETLARAFMHDVICQDGLPQELISDRGTNYTSSRFAELCQLLGLQHHFATAFHHQSNCQVEHFNKVIDILCPRQSGTMVSISTFGYPSYTMHLSIRLLMKRHFILYMVRPNLTYVQTSTPATTFDAREHKNFLADHLMSAWPIVKQSLQKAYRTHKDYHDHKHHTTLSTLKEGIFVLLRIELPRTHKYYNTGP